MELYKSLSFPYGMVIIPSCEKDSLYKILERNGNYQPYINHWIRQYGRNNSILIDVGANMGLFTIAMSKLFPNSVVYSFEPVKTTYGYLERNIVENKCDNVASHQVALGNRNQKMFYFCNYGKSGSSEVYYLENEKDVDKKVDGKPFYTKGEMDGRTLDSYHLDNISLIKVDIQGFEYEFLKGAIETLKECHPVLIMEYPLRSDLDKLLYRKSLRILRKIGYQKVQRVKKDVLFIWKEPSISSKGLASNCGLHQ